MKKAKTTKATKTPEAQMAKHLANVLSDTYVLAVKLHGYHWNVTGPSFGGLHEFFGKQYEELFNAADEIAERIRAIGLMPDGSMDSFLQNTVIEEAGTKALVARDMIADLITSYEQIVVRFKTAEDYADEIDDIVTQDMMVGRIAAHEKTLWMMRSFLA